MKYISHILVLILLIGCSSTSNEEDSVQLENYFENSGLPAAIMGSIQPDGNVEWKAFGPAVWDETGTVDENHIFRIFSMTKALTSVAAMQLVESGQISLDESLNDLMPEMASIPILTESGSLVESSSDITLRHLLTHTAGFGYGFTSQRLQNFDRENWSYEDNPRLFEPGENWRYGTNTDWVGKVIEKVSGSTLEEYF